MDYTHSTIYSRENVTDENVQHVECVLSRKLPSTGKQLDKLILSMNCYIPREAIFNSPKAKAEFLAKAVVEFQKVRPIPLIEPPAFPKTIDEVYLVRACGFLKTPDGSDWIKQLLQPAAIPLPSPDGQDASRIPQSDPGQDVIAPSNTPTHYVPVESRAARVGESDGYDEIPAAGRLYQQAGLLEEGGNPGGRGISGVRANNGSDDLQTRSILGFFCLGVVVIVVMFFILS